MQEGPRKTYHADELHLDVFTRRHADLDIAPDKSIRLKNHAVISKYCPELFPKIVITDAEQRASLMQQVIDRFPNDSPYKKRLQRATKNQVYAVERITEPMWAELKKKLSLKQHIEVAITVLSQLQTLYERSGIILEDRNDENIFVKSDLTVVQTDFDTIYDACSDSKVADTSIERSTVKIKDEEKTKTMIVLNILSFFTKFETQLTRANVQGIEKVIEELTPIRTKLLEMIGQDPVAKSPEESPKKSVFSQILQGITDVFTDSNTPTKIPLIIEEDKEGSLVGVALLSSTIQYLKNIWKML